MTETVQVFMPIIVGVLVGVIFITIMQVAMNWRGIQTYFNMVPRREIMTETTWGKYTVLARELETGISVWKSYDKTITYSMSVSYKEGDSEISNRFREDDINLVVDKAYAWSLERGIIKE